MAAASASSHKTKHHSKPKAKHHTTKTVAKAGLNPGSKLCVEAYAGESNSGAAGSAIEKAMISAETSGNWDAAKQALDAAMNASLKEESQAEAALRSAPANVQAAMKGLFTYVQSFETAINNSSSFTQFATSMESLVQSSGIQADSTTLTNYLTQQCGPPPTTTPPSLSIP
jgi:cobalamin biosynthesis Mg chelatase CobN